MAPVTLPDAAARREAASTFGRNLVITAGAGAGKTSLLVERALNAVGSGSLEIGQIAAITFTEKAAAEMRVRLARSLDRLRARAVGEGAPPDKEDQRAFDWLVGEAGVPPAEVAARALRALEGLERARIATIHSFCADLIREHPVEVRVAPDFQVEDLPREEAVFRSEWEAFLGAELGADSPRPELWRRLLRRVPADALRDAARELAGWLLPARERGTTATPPRVDRELRAAARSVDGRLARIQTVAPGAAEMPRRFLEGARAVLGALAEGGIAAARAALQADDDLRRRVAPSGNLPGYGRSLAAVAEGEFKAAVAEAAALLRGVGAVDEGLLADLQEVLDPFCVAHREALLRGGLVSFDALLVLARDLLRDHPDVRQSLHRRYRMILVDEFQDTDPVQYEIVLYLGARAGEAGADPFALGLEPGRLFVVGDPKQSIYRFRGADFSAAQEAMARIASAGGEELHLTANFRSRPAILEAVNALFAAGSGGAWEPSPEQPDYEPIDATREDTAEETAVELWTVDAGAGGANSRREAEGAVLAAAIREMVEAGRAAYRDILVLFRSMSNVSRYLRPLRDAGVPFVVDGGKEFLERQEVAQMLAALRALARPADTAALLAFLRSPAAGASDVELARWAAAGGRWNWREEPDPEAFPALARAFHVLRGLAVETRGLPADAVIRRVLASTGMLPVSAMAFQGAQRVANLRKITAAAADLARDGRLSLDDILDILEEARASDVESESPLADEGDDVVRILSIHKAKGLESKLVFLPDLAREGRSGGDRVPAVRVEALRFPGGRAVPAIRMPQGRCNAAWVLRDHRGRRHEEAEEVRTLYVALTRARDRLILITGQPGRRPAAWLPALRPWRYDPAAPPDDGATLAHGVRHRRARPVAGASSPTGSPDTGATEAVRRYQEAAARWRREARPPFAHPSGEWEARALAGQEAEGAPALPRPGPPGGEEAAGGGSRADLARAVGTVVHRLLERWDGADPAALRSPLAALCRDAAAGRRVEPAAVEAEAAALLDRFLASDLPARLRRADVLGREVPLLLDPGDGVTWRGSIDLLYRAADGAVVVADYKTDRDEAGAAERHGDQLRIYAAAVQRAMGLTEPPRVELWMLRAGRVIPL